MKPKEIEPTEYEGGDKKVSLKRNGMRKCQYNESGHEFELVRPQFLGKLGLDNIHRSLKEVYQNEIEHGKVKGWMKDKVFFYWTCKHCQKKKFDMLSIAKAQKLVDEL